MKLLYGLVLFTLAVTPLWEAPKNIAVGLAIIAWLILPRGQRVWPRPFRWLGWLVVVAFFSAVGAISPWDGFFGTADWLRILLFGLAAAAAVTDAARLRTAITVVAVSTAAAAGFVLLRFYLGAAPAADVRSGLSVLSLGFSNQAATYLALALLCQLHLLARPERDARLAGLLTLAPTVTALWATTSRGGWIAALLAGAYFLLRRGNRRMVITLVVVLALLAPILAANPAARGQLASLYRVVIHNYPPNEKSGLYWRIHLWRQCGEVIAEHPLLGVGPKNFKWLDPERHLREWQYADHAHNILVNLGVETGLVGLAVFCGFLASAVRASFRPGVGAPTVVQGAVIVLLVAGLATTTFHSEGGLLFAALVGMGLGGAPPGPR